MTLVAEADQRRIADAITEAERTTSGEIVAMITPESASYLHGPFLWAALAALALPWPFVFWTWWPIQHIYVLQLAVFAALVVVLMPRPVRLALMPRSVKHARAHRRAVEQFLGQMGAEGLFQEGAWQAIVADLTEHIGKGQAGDGFVRAIAAVGEHLARHFPPDANRPHALGNHLIVLPPA